MSLVTNNSNQKKKKKKSQEQQDKQVYTFRECSNWQPTMLDESCKGKRRKGNPVSFCKIRGSCQWLAISTGLLKILLWQQLYWLFYEGLLKILALGFLFVSILRSNIEVVELPDKEAVVMDIQQFANVWDWQVDECFGRALISSNHCL